MKTAYRSPHILLIDDDEKLCALMRDYLSPQDMEVSIALKGADGLRLAREEHCDLILLDLMLPDMNGLEILRELRRTSSVPIIILSAQDSEADRVAGLEMGSDDYISKPFSPRELLAACALFCGVSPRRHKETGQRLLLTGISRCADSRWISTVWKPLWTAGSFLSRPMSSASSPK